MIKKILLSVVFCFFFGCGGSYHYNAENPSRLWIVTSKSEYPYFGQKGIMYVIRETEGREQENRSYRSFYLYTNKDFELGDELIVIKKENK